MKHEPIAIPRYTKHELLAIAVKAQREQDDAVFNAAYDAATRPEERAEFVAEMERIWRERNEAYQREQERLERCGAYEIRTGKEAPDWMT